MSTWLTLLQALQHEQQKCHAKILFHMYTVAKCQSGLLHNRHYKMANKKVAKNNFAFDTLLFTKAKCQLCILIIGYTVQCSTQEKYQFILATIRYKKCKNCDRILWSLPFLPQTWWRIRPYKSWELQQHWSSGDRRGSTNSLHESLK